MNNGKTFIISLLLALISYNSKAQSSISDANGRPMISSKNSEIEGSPYLFEEWQKGSVKLSNGTVYDNTELKLDLLDNHLLFKGSNDEPLMFSEPVKEFTLLSNDGTSGRLFRSGYESNDNYYEVLSDGKCSLLKLHKKSIGAKAAYASSNSVKMILDAISYYIYKSSSLISIKKDKKSVLSIFSDKQTELEDYIKINHINCKEDADLVKLIKYYNSLL